MIKRLNSPELSAAKPRTGMQHVSVVIERLMKMYDMQAEMNEMRTKEFRAEKAADQQIMAAQSAPAVQPTLVISTDPVCGLMPAEVTAVEQSTFGWE